MRYHIDPRTYDADITHEPTRTPYLCPLCEGPNAMRATPCLHHQRESWADYVDDNYDPSGEL